jgi:aminopeptidase N
MRVLRAVAVCVALCACKPAERPRPAAASRDPHSHAEPDRVAVRHLALDLTVDFTQRVLHGTAQLSLTRRDRAAELRLDVNGLAIESAVDCTTKQPLAWRLEPKRPFIGQALVVAPADCVAIAYRTGPDAQALLWVEPSGTTGKQKPMLFTQSQAIHAHVDRCGLRRALYVRRDDRA